MTDFYRVISRLSTEITGPLMNVFYSVEVPILSAILLGLVASFAPCQISANIGSLTYFTHRMTKGNAYWELVAYLVGRVVVYSLLGGMVVFLGKSLSNELIPMFTWSKKLMGPLLILVGVALLGVLPTLVSKSLPFSNLNHMAERVTGTKKAFVMGVLFSLGFCPTMFWLFFGLLIPMAQTHSLGVLDPLSFSVGTIIPLLALFAFLGETKISGTLIKRFKKWGSMLQLGMGIMLILIGMMDIVLFW